MSVCLLWKEFEFVEVEYQHREILEYFPSVYAQEYFVETSGTQVSCDHTLYIFRMCQF